MLAATNGGAEALRLAALGYMRLEAFATKRYVVVELRKLGWGLAGAMFDQ